MPAAGLTLETLIGPVAAATILNAIWFAVIWRGHQYERRQGKMPWQFDLALGAYIAANGLAFYITKSGALTTGSALFGAAFVSETTGVVIVYALLWGFVFTRGQSWRERAFPIGLSVMLTGGMIAATLKA